MGIMFNQRLYIYIIHHIPIIYQLLSLQIPKYCCSFKTFISSFKTSPMDGYKWLIKDYIYIYFITHNITHHMPIIYDFVGCQARQATMHSGDLEPFWMAARPAKEMVPKPAPTMRPQKQAYLAVEPWDICAYWILTIKYVYCIYIRYSKNRITVDSYSPLKKLKKLN